MLMTGAPTGRVIILTGSQGSGKTTNAMRLAGEAAAQGMPFQGVISPVVYEAGQRIGYDLADITSGERAPLARIDARGVQRQGLFVFLPEGLALAARALTDAAARLGEPALVDEVGPLELRGLGFAPWLKRLALKKAPLMLTVRPNLVVAVIKRFRLTGAMVYDLEVRTQPLRLDDIMPRFTR
ncbi:DUF2478 domain-containing protein [bacterium]|nr:DUF2478 domain-containing protein [candidate division CSSED10-310 bacterium]